MRCATLVVGFTIVLASLALTRVSRADIPLPGTHGSPKRWQIGITVTNFSPFAFDGPIVALTPDKRGGVWFGLGRTLEHIDATGKMQNFEASSEWLWQIGGIAYDPSGRLWFSLGQSGRVGTIDSHGRLQTRILVARDDFPDIRTIAFDAKGTLWFQDVGRRSIGRRLVDGSVREIPLPDKGYLNPLSTGDLTICNSQIWIAASSNHLRADGSYSAPPYVALYAVQGDLHALRRVHTWTHEGHSSIACDSQGNLWFTHASSTVWASLAGFIDRRNGVHEQRVDDQYQRVFAGWNGSIWFAGYDSRQRLWSTPRFLLTRQIGDHTVEWMLPIRAYTGSLTTTADGTVWLSVIYPHSVVRLKF
jgi:hypothetical protein